MSRYQKGKTNLDFTEARDSEWQWYQLGHMQVCTSLQTDNHTSSPAPHHSVFLQAGCPSWRPTNSVKERKAKALKAKKQSYALTTKSTTCVIQYRGYFADIMQKRIATTCSLGLPPTGPFTHLLIIYLLQLKPHSKMQAYRTHNHAR